MSNGYFENSSPEILSNDLLRAPQKNGYFEVYEHFVVKGNKTNAIVVLPTGVGKTGLMALLPFHISKGKVLIIAPQIVIRDTVVDALNPQNPACFWLKQKVFSSVSDLPALVEYQGRDTSREILDHADIVVTNAQKLQTRLESSLLHSLPVDYFDMIIVDEAHHSTAKTWVDTLHHFSHAKVIKITATPFRTDSESIVGELVYKYKLSQAMAKGYIKSLENFTYIPEKLYLTLDGNKEKKYTIEEVRDMNLRDDEWISRSVVYSEECKASVVDESLTLLTEKLRGTSVPHKIIAVAPNIDEAIKINDLYIERGVASVVVHNRLNDDEKSRAFSDIKNHRVQVIVNVSMLGEGYDHPYLSIAAIFRAFKNPLPYVQFIGRVLRAIPENEVQKASDNIGNIIAHKYLGLEELWRYYKTEIQESNVIKTLDEIVGLEEDMNEDSADPANPTQSRDSSIGTAVEEGNAVIQRDAYLETEVLRKHRASEEERHKKIEELQKTLSISKPAAEKILDSVDSSDSSFKRPDLLFKSKKRNIDTSIKEDIIPKILVSLEIDSKGNELKDSNLFNGKYKWITRKANFTNGGGLAIYFSTYLNEVIGYKRADWSLQDYDIAFEKLSEAEQYVESLLLDEFYK